MMTRTRALLFVIVLLIVGGGWNIYTALRGASHLADAQHELGSLRLATLESCARLNILRVEDNRSHLADYHVFRIVLVESRQVPERPGTTRIERRFNRLFLQQLDSAVHAKTWTPRTDCSRAVNERGVRFRAPHPVAIATRLPARSALSLYPSDFR